MRVSADHITCAKVLIFVTLFAWSATIVATAELTATDVTPDLKALQRQQSFESENTEGRQSSHDDEERKPSLESVVGDVEAGLGRLMNKLSLTRTQKTTMKHDFAGFFLGTSYNKFFESKYFPNWADSVYRRFEDTAEGKEMALYTMLEMLVEDLKGNLAADILAATKIDGRTKDIAAELLNAIFKLWVSHGWSPAEILAALKFDGSKEFLFGNPMFRGWATFFHLKYREYPIMDMMNFLHEVYPQDNDMVRFVVEGLKAENTKPFAEALLDDMIELWSYRELKKKTVKTILGLDTMQEGDVKTYLQEKWAAYEKNDPRWGKVQKRKHREGYKRVNPSPQREHMHMMNFLHEVYPDDVDVVRFVVEGLKAEDTKPVAEAFLDYMIGVWADRRLEKKTVKTILGLDTMQEGDVKSFLQEKLAAYNPVEPSLLAWKKRKREDRRNRWTPYDRGH